MYGCSTRKRALPTNYLVHIVAVFVWLKASYSPSSYPHLKGSRGGGELFEEP